MTLASWAAFALFWVAFVVSPGPKAVNCVANGMAYGLRRAIWPQMPVIYPPSLSITAVSTIGWTAPGARMVRSAMGAVANGLLRWITGAAFGAFGAALMLTA